MADTTNKEIAQMLLDAVDEEMEESLVIASKIGEDALAISRSEHAYETQTGNLQSSCGFALTYNGKIVAETPFTPDTTKHGAAKEGKRKSRPAIPDGETGSREGKAYLEECLQDRLEQGITLTLVAGMEYAGYVEDQGLDVLRSAEEHVRREFDKWERGLL